MLVRGIMFFDAFSLKFEVIVEWSVVVGLTLVAISWHKMLIVQQPCLIVYMGVVSMAVNKTFEKVGVL